MCAEQRPEQTITQADNGLWIKVEKTSRHHLGRALRFGRGLVWGLARPVAARPVFVVGCSRGGTTLVYKTFSESGELGSLGRETHDYWAGLHPIEGRGWRSHELTATDASESDRLAVSRFFYVGTGRRRFVDKNNQNGLAIPYLHALFPDAHFVYIKRSPGDNICSLMEGWRREEAFGSWSESLPRSVAVDDGRYTRWCFFLPVGWEAYLQAPLEEVCAFQYRAMNEAILEARNGIPASQWSEIRYEDVLADPVGEFQRVFKEAGVVFDDYLRSHCDTVLTNPYNAFSEIRKDKWLASPDAERIRSVMGEVRSVASRMGYGP